MDPKTYPLWKFQNVVFPATNPTIRVVFQLTSAVDYLLKKIYVQYPTTGPAPVTFQDPSLRVVDNSHGKKNPFLIPVETLSSPGRFDDLGSGNNPILNQQVTNAMSTDWMFWNTSTIELEITDYLGVGGPSNMGILVTGRAFFKRDENH